MAKESNLLNEINDWTTVQPPLLVVEGSSLPPTLQRGFGLPKEHGYESEAGGALRANINRLQSSTADNIVFIGSSNTGGALIYKDSVKKKYLLNLLERAKHITFETGMTNELSSKLSILLTRDSDFFLNEFNEIVTQDNIEPSIICECIRVISEIKVSNYEIQFKIIISALRSSYAEMRDSASLAFMELQNIAAIPYLTYALDKEEYPFVKDSIEDAISYLKGL